MKRTDLVQRLSDTSSRFKKEHSDEQHSALIQKVATMAAVRDLLLETLNCLSEKELHKFMAFLQQIVSQKDLTVVSYKWSQTTDRTYTVDLMMETFRQQSVELTREVLEKMNRTDLMQILSETSLTLKEKHSVDKHQPTPAAEAVKENVEQTLFHTLKGLSLKELEKFRILLQFTYFQKSLPQIQWIKTEQVDQMYVLVDLMVKNQQPVEVTKEVLLDMNRSDLVERLSGTSSGLTEKSQPGWLQRVETLTSAMELLMETLADLSKEELRELTTILKHTFRFRLTSDDPWRLLDERDHQLCVFSIIMTSGQYSVETTREILEEMKRTDLVQRLSDTSSRSKKEHSDEQHSALIQKVATMAAVRHLLLETLHCLSEKELHEFKRFLQQIVPQKDLRAISYEWSYKTDRAGKVDLMMKTYGQQSVELTREVLEKMNRTDLMQILSETSLTLKEKHSVDKHQPTPAAEEVKENVERTLFHTLWSLSLKELDKFRILLQFTYFQKTG
ncbi:uncharacterized protein LOC117822700 [Notolabrus celidotus]|uniref:uncharacterized protein LOC117822700 n=1 Tax=Notolabrus celidotus TaxID=1203425 RepID=UPI00148FE563|nr:uncharacterized protein LOC117822700 [Notolabrus celidotus]